MTNLFPIIQPEAETPVQARLPLCREVAWDFARGVPVYAGGRPVEVTGVEAVRVWIWTALKTARFHHDIYTWDYGCEAESLIGKALLPRSRKARRSGMCGRPWRPIHTSGRSCRRRSAFREPGWRSPAGCLRFTEKRR